MDYCFCLFLLMATCFCGYVVIFFFILGELIFLGTLFGKTLCPGFKVLSFGKFLYLLFPDALEAFKTTGHLHGIPRQGFLLLPQVGCMSTKSI